MLDYLMLSEDEKRGLKTPLCRTPVSDLLQFAAQFLPTALYPSTLSDASLFGMHSLPTLMTSTVSNFPRNDPIYTVGSSYCSAVSESTVNKHESEMTDKRDDVTARASRLSSVDSRPQVSTPISDGVTNYPPMPATAQHVSEVQERILRGSSVNEDMCSPIQADTVDVGHAGETPDVFPDVSDLHECLSDVGCQQREKVIETPRSVTHRRSRIAARFVSSNPESTPDGS